MNERLLGSMGCFLLLSFYNRLPLMIVKRKHQIDRMSSATCDAFAPFGLEVTAAAGLISRGRSAMLWFHLPAVAFQNGFVVAAIGLLETTDGC